MQEADSEVGEVVGWRLETYLDSSIREADSTQVSPEPQVQGEKGEQVKDSEFCEWFAKHGHKWRGWPEWKEADHRVRLATAGSAHDGGDGAGYPSDVLTTQGYNGVWWNWESRGDHEAACLIRDFLYYHPNTARLIAGRTTEEMNRILACYVKAHMKEEGK